MDDASLTLQIFFVLMQTVVQTAAGRDRGGGVLMGIFPGGCRISIVIPVHNGGENFRRCLASASAIASPDCEIIVVADGDSDGSWKLAEEAGMRVVRIPESGGPARARNLGAREARGDILFFVDADVLMSPETVQLVLAAFQTDPGLAALFGSYDDDPSAGNFLSQYKNLFHHYVHQTARETATTFWSGCGAIRREIFASMGGFDEDFRRPSIEDVELGYRLTKAGYRIRLIKEIQVKHLKRWGVRSLLRADILYRALPWTALILREGKLLNDLNLKLSSRISTAAIYLLMASLAFSVRFPWLLVPAVACALALLALNWDLYRFFFRKRGLLFAALVIPWNWLYFFYSGLAFSLGYVRHHMGRIPVKTS
jgi:GT2 family glycosyltransferase